MSGIKSLLKQTAVYGLSSIVVRMFNWVLTPIYTGLILKKEIGIHADFMSMVAFLNIIYMLGMETSFFRYSRDYEKKIVYTMSQTMVVANSLLWTGLFILFAGYISSKLHYQGKEIYIYLIAMTLFLENLCNIPFANLRYENRATEFVALKVFNILICMSLNILFLKFWYTRGGNPSDWKNDAVIWIFIANLIPWVLTFLYFLKDIIRHISWKKNEIWREMIWYSLPMTIVGLAGMANETLDRVLLKNWLPYNLDRNLEELAIYNVNYKLAIIITLIIQAFRMGAEPFFFKISKDKNARATYAIVMDFFIMVCCIVMVLTSLNRELIALVYEKSFIVGIRILPIILLANVFLGIYYNLSVWFKLSNRTYYGAVISCVGAAITLILNWYWIPRIGYVGSALATLICYFSMALISYVWGQRVYRIPYHLGYNLAWIGGSLSFSTVIFYYFQTSMIALILFSVAFSIIAGWIAYRRFLFIKERIV